MDNIYASYHHYYSEIIIDVMMSGLSNVNTHCIQTAGGGGAYSDIFFERKRDAE